MPEGKKEELLDVMSTEKWRTTQDIAKRLVGRTGGTCIRS
jgi:hypothetical protein